VESGVMRTRTGLEIRVVEDPSPLEAPSSLPETALCRLRWLGQAGFLIETVSSRYLVDPYLSDSLAVKYRGAPFAHRRMMDVPVDPASLVGVDFCLSTHGHTDHLDPRTIGPLARADPACRFVAPAACAQVAVSRGVPASRLFPADAFADLELGELSVHPIPSAHESLAIDGAGHHLFLGYLLSLPGLRIYHAGDCVPYEGLVGNLASWEVDLALLPINGRDEVRRAAGIPGNFNLAEAIALAKQARFGCAIGHHFGMFDFNTVEPETALAKIESERVDNFLIARSGVSYILSAAH